MSDLLLHPKTAARLGIITASPPHSILVTGKAGSGKATIAAYLASELLSTELDKLASHPYLYKIQTNDETIKIEQIREVQQFLKLKVPTEGKGVNRVIIIESAERMGHEAQNALLKTLEEPPADTVLILTVESTDNLLETIVSRCQELAVLPISREQASQYFLNKGIRAADFSPAYALSMGQAGLLTALLDSQSHLLKEQVATAKQILSEPLDKRLFRVESVAKDKQTIHLLLDALQRINHAGLVSASQSRQIPAINRWHERQKATLEAMHGLRHNANSKLLLTDLFIRL